MGRIVPTGRFRRRLTIAFILVSGIAAGTVGLGAFLLVRDVRFDDFVDRSLRDAHANFLTVQERVQLEVGSDIGPLVERFEHRSAEATIMVGPSGVYSSDSAFDQQDIPSDLAAPETYEEGMLLPREDVTVAGEDYLVVATPFTGPETGMYFFYSRTAVQEGLGDLARITWRLWLTVVIIAALVGNALARRTLRPVSRASEAAQSLSEGLLETRLPVESEDEFGAWAASFNQMADALETKIAELMETRDRERQFTSDVSHELRTPVTALVSSASMLEQGLDRLDPETRWIARRMIDEARRLRTLVDDLLEMSRLNSGHEVPRSTEVDLGRVIENVITNRHWDGAVTFKPQRVIVSTDKGRIERITANLIDNAIEHGRTRPQVRVGKNVDSAFVEVQDGGGGIPAAALPHIFERFYKADPSRAGGSGLGLAIAAEHARLLGGSISVSSIEGKGSTFTLTIPASSSAETVIVDNGSLHG